jgi:transposase
MEQYAGIDVSLESASVCVVEASGRVLREAKVASEPEALIAWFGKLGVEMTRIGLELGPLSLWLYAGMRGWRWSFLRRAVYVTRSRGCQ